MCGELLHVQAQKIQSEKTKKTTRMPWERLYDLIMAPEIEQLHKGEVFPLKPVTLKSWLGKSIKDMSNPPGDDAFKYVHRYIERLDLEGELTGLRIKLFRRFIEHHKSTLSFIHGSPKVAKSQRPIVRNIEDSKLIAMDASSKSLHLLLVGEFVGGVVDFTMYHHPLNGQINFSPLLIRTYLITPGEVDAIVNQIERSSMLTWTHGFGILDEDRNGENEDECLSVTGHWCRTQGFTKTPVNRPAAVSTAMTLAGQELTICQPLERIFDIYGQSHPDQQYLLFRKLGERPDKLNVAKKNK